MFRNALISQQTPTTYAQPPAAFHPIITTSTGYGQERYMENPNFKLAPKDHASAVEVINKKPKKRNPLDGETVRELSNNIVELTPNIKEVRKVIKKMVNLIEMDDMEHLQF